MTDGAKIELPSKTGDKILVISNPKIGGILRIKIGDEEVLIPGPALTGAVAVVQADQQFSDLDGLRVT